MNKKIMQLLKGKGIKMKLRGYMYLHDAIQITIDNGNVIPLSISLYEKIASKYNETAISVETAIRYAIKSSNDCDCTNAEFIISSALEISLNN